MISAALYSADNIRKSAVHYLFGRGIAGLAGFATVILLVRFMGLEDYAAYTALSGLVATPVDYRSRLIGSESH